MLKSRKNALLLTLAAASWGLGAVVSKRAVDEIPPFTLLPIQLGTSLAVFSLLMRWRGLPLRDPNASPWLARLGTLNPGLAYALSLVGLVHITVSMSVMLWALEPLMILGLAVWLLRERVSPWLVALTPVAITEDVHSTGPASSIRSSRRSTVWMIWRTSSSAILRPRQMCVP